MKSKSVLNETMKSCKGHFKYTDTTITVFSWSLQSKRRSSIQILDPRCPPMQYFDMTDLVTLRGFFFLSLLLYTGCNLPSVST